MGITFPKIPRAVAAELAGNAVSFSIVWIVGILSTSAAVSTILIVAGDSIPSWAVLILIERRVGRGLF